MWMGSTRGDGCDGGRGWSQWWSGRNRLEMGWASWVQAAYVTSQDPCHTPDRPEWPNEGQSYPTKRANGKWE